MWTSLSMKDKKVSFWGLGTHFLEDEVIEERDKQIGSLKKKAIEMEQRMYQYH
jgi:hypothetical protein